MVKEGGKEGISYTICSSRLVLGRWYAYRHLSGASIVVEASSHGRRYYICSGRLGLVSWYAYHETGVPACQNNP